MTVLREFGAARGNLAQGAAGTCNRASQMVYEHPWGMQAHALPELLLPALIGNFFDGDVVTDTYNLIDQSPMQALAMSSQLAFLVCQSPSGGKVALAILPGEAPLAVFLDPPLFVVVLWVVGTTLSIEFAL